MCVCGMCGSGMHQWQPLNQQTATTSGACVLQGVGPTNGCQAASVLPLRHVQLQQHLGHKTLTALATSTCLWKQQSCLQVSPVASCGCPCRDCWCVAFGNSHNDDERCVLAGYDNGDVKLFDLRTNKVSEQLSTRATECVDRVVAHTQGRRACQPTYCAPSLLFMQLRWETNVKNGVCGVSFDRRDIPMNKFMVTCLESVFHVYDARTQHPNKVGPAVSALCHLSSACRQLDPWHTGCAATQMVYVLDTVPVCPFPACAWPPHAVGSSLMRPPRQQAATCCCWLTACSQGFAGASQRVGSGTGGGSTVWGAHPLPQNREVVMVASGDGSVSLWKYQYPDQRKVKVCRGWLTCCAIMLGSVMS